jgi:SpoVK/Ycf46/Vps4 family AAA+-type ATPase
LINYAVHLPLECGVRRICAEYLSELKNLEPSVILIDEIDALAPNRDDLP